MGELIFVALMAVGIALGVFMLAVLILFTLYVVIIEIRYWRRVRRIHKARVEMLKRELANQTVRKRVHRRLEQIKGNEQFLAKLRREIGEL